MIIIIRRNTYKFYLIKIIRLKIMCIDYEANIARIGLLT